MPVLSYIGSLGVAFALLCAVGFAADGHSPNDSTLCAEAQAAMAVPEVHDRPTMSQSEARAIQKFENRQERQKRYDDNKVETHRQELEKHYPGAKVRYLNQGGESIVYSVTFPDGRALAVKVPVDDYRGKIAKAYETERAILAKIASADPEGAKHVIPSHDAPEIQYKSKKIKPLVMDLGTQSLRAALGEFGPKTDKKVLLNLWKEMALGVRAVKRAGYVHRDIKPGNWILKPDTDGNPHLYLTDFGVAREKDSDPDLQEIQGTLTFMSANQMRGGSPIPADDLHSLVCSMKEMLIGTEIWKIDQRDPANHIRLVDVNEWGRYPVLDQLPDKTKAAADPKLVALLERNYDNVEELLGAIEQALATP